MNNTEIMLIHGDQRIRDALGLTKHSQAMVLEIEKIVRGYVNQFEAIARELLPQLPDDWKIRCRIDWRNSKKYAGSYGGCYAGKWRSEVLMEHQKDTEIWTRRGSAISLQGSVFPETTEDWNTIDVWSEYQSFFMDLEIGDFSGSRRDVTQCLIAHECAHAVQFTRTAIEMGAEWWLNNLGRPTIHIMDRRTEWFSGHELLFQCIYRNFRCKSGLINHPPENEQDRRLRHGKLLPTMCIVCSKPLPPVIGRGRVRKFCGSGCRSKAWREKAS